MGHSALGHGFGRGGRREDAIRCLHILERVDARSVNPYHKALVHAGLGNVEEAITCRRQAAATDSVWLRIFGPQDPRLDSLRADERFSVLLKQSMKAAGG